MGKFWIVGGEASLPHAQEAIGDGETWIGPFDNYRAALLEWERRESDRAGAEGKHFRIERIDTEAPPPCTD